MRRSSRGRVSEGLYLRYYLYRLYFLPMALARYRTAGGTISRPKLAAMRTTGT